MHVNKLRKVNSISNVSQMRLQSIYVVIFKLVVNINDQCRLEFILQFVNCKHNNNGENKRTILCIFFFFFCPNVADVLKLHGPTFYGIQYDCRPILQCSVREMQAKYYNNTKQTEKKKHNHYDEMNRRFARYKPGCRPTTFWPA